jgi:hypothetical protein
MTPCSFIGGNQCFGGRYCLYKMVNLPAEEPLGRPTWEDNFIWIIRKWVIKI